MKRISWLLIIVFLLSVVMPGVNLLWELDVAADTLRAAKITAVQGDVKILRAGGEKHFPAFKSMGLTQGDTVITGKDGRVTLEIAADKELKIGENSRVMISELVQSDSTNADKTSLNLKAGQVYTNIKGKLSPDAKYEIRTPTAVMGVRGTQFFVTLASGVQAKVVTLEGNVVVTVPQLVTLEDGTTITQDVEIEVQPNQIFVQTGDMTDTGKYDLSTLTGDVALSLFVLETLKEISEEQPDLINPEILQNLEDMIERAREEQQQQQQQQEMLQQLQPNIQFDTIGTTSGGTTGGASGNTSGDNDDDDYAEQPRVVINTQLDDISIRYGIDHGRSIHINTNPSSGVVLQVNIQNENIAEANVSGNNITIFGLQPGSTRITVTASRTGYLPAEKSFMFTVYEDIEEGDWDKTIINDEYGEHTDIALDSKGMPHIIYEDVSVRYRYWNGSYWQEEEPQIGSQQGSLAIAEIDGNDYSFISYNYFSGSHGYDVFNGENWSHHYLLHEGVTVAASSIDTVQYDGGYGIGVSYYDETNGDLYFRFNPYPLDGYFDDWSAPFRVDGVNSDAGEASSLAFGEDGKAYIAYYDYSDDRETGSLKLAVIDELLDPVLLDIMEVDDQVGYSEGQYVSVAVDDGELPIIHIAYYDAVDNNLKYAVLYGEEQFIVPVDDSEGDVGKYASLALDNEGNPHISYYAESDLGEALKYARLDPDHEGEWLIEIIDQGEEVGMYSSIALDNNLPISIPHFAYTAMVEGNWVVKHATRQGIMNTIEPGILSGTEQAFEDASFYINSFGNEVCGVWREAGAEIDYLEENEDYTISEDDEGLIFTLKSSFLNSLGITYYEEPHRIWIHFDSGLPVLITIEVTENLEAYTVRDNPDLAYDSENNRYLMVYERDIAEYIYSEIWGRFITAEGILGKEFKISSEERCHAPKVVYNPDNNDFLVVWWQEGYPDKMYAQIIDEEWGTNSELENFLVCPDEESSADQHYPAVAVNTAGDEYLVAWIEADEVEYAKKVIYGQRLNYNGERINEDKLNLTNDIVSSKLNPSLVFAGNKYILIFESDINEDDDDKEIMGVSLTSAGVFYEEIEIDTDGKWNCVPTITGSNDDGLFLVVWIEFEETKTIYGRFINAEGTVGEDFPIRQSEEDLFRPSVALNTTNGSYLIAWENEYSVCTQQLTEEGMTLGIPEEISSDEGWNSNIKAVYNPDEGNYLVAYENYGEGNTRIGITILSVPEEALKIKEKLLAAGETHSLVVRDGQVWSTGYSNASYTLGLSPVEELDGVVVVSANDSYSLALKEDGTVWAWGKNDIGQLGNGADYLDDPVPQMVSGLDNIVDISAGASHALALKADGTVWAWGDNNKYKLGIGSEDYKTHTPRQVKVDSDNYLTGVVAIGAGFDHSLALKADGTVWAWGDNVSAQLGQGAGGNDEEAYPVQVKDSTGSGYLTDVMAIDAGPMHNLALIDGEVWSWGYNYYGQLGDGTQVSKALPVQVLGVDGEGYLTDIVRIAAGGNWAGHSLALDDSGNAYAWGNGEYGQLGLGSYYERKTSPAEVLGLTAVEDIAAGGEYGTSLFLEADGTVKACGSNDCGELGDGSETERYSVVTMIEASQIPSEEDIIVTNYVTGPDTVKVDNVPPGATVKVYASSSASTPLGSGTMPEDPEGSYVIVSIEDGLPLDSNFVRVTITEEGKAESRKTDKWIPTPVMREPYDFEIDTVDYVYGKVTFVMENTQIAAIEDATGKGISKIIGFVGEYESYFDGLPEPDDMNIDTIELEYNEELDKYIGSIVKEPGNYPCAIAVYDDTDNVIAYYVHDGWKTVW